MRLTRIRAASAAAITAFLGLIAAATACGYFLTFGQFARYDDESYILQSVRSWLDGQRLFDDVFTQYGPAFYLFESFVHSVLGAPLTHDFGRFLTIGLWVTCSAGCALITWRLSESLIAAGWTFVGAFVQLIQIVNEPNHPQGLMALVVTAVVLLAVWHRDSGPTTRGVAVMGVLTAVALLSKINVGTFLALGVGLPLALRSRLPRTAWTAMALTGLCMAACALPLVVMKNHAASWAMAYALTISASLAAVLLAVSAVPDERRPASRLVVYAGACALGGALLLIPVLWRGTSLLALWNGVIVRPSHLAEVFPIPLVLPPKGLIATAASTMLALAYFVWTWRGAAVPPLVISAVKLGAACVGLYALHDGYAYAVAYVTPLLWISIPGIREGQPARAFGIEVLATTAVLEAMQAYPVAGSQRSFATFLMVPALFTLLHDALALPLRHVLQRPRAASVVASVALLAGGLSLYFPFLQMTPWRARYDRNYALRLPGAEHLRLPGTDVARFQWLSANAAARCDMLLTLPGLYSLNFWSRVGPPGHSNVSAWPIVLDPSEQATMWTRLDASSRPCAVYNRALVDRWTQASGSESSAATQLKARLVMSSALWDYEFYVRPGQRSAESPVLLFAGRQRFERGDTPLPIVPPLSQRDSSIRLWFRARLPGVLLGCQTRDFRMASTRWVPLVYVGRSGRLYGQHLTATTAVQATPSPINDGAWHHAVLVNSASGQRFFVDGAVVGALTATATNDGMARCQVGAGITTGWPDIAPDSGFQGDIESLVVAERAWNAADVRADRAATFPRDGVTH